MNIKIFTVGGTIDKIYFDAKSKYEVGKPMISELLDESNICVNYSVEPLMAKDSLEMTDEDRILLAKAIAKDKNTRILVTHGTDTMIKSALEVKKQIDKTKTVVFTGSMSPAIFKDSDAVFNVGGALIAVQTLSPGVYISMNGRIFDPEKSIKNVEMNRFEDK